MTPIERFEAMLANGQDSDMLRLSLGQAYFKAGDFARSAMHLQKAVELKPDYSVAWKLLGRAEHERGELAAALDAYDRGLEVSARNGDKQAEKEITVFRRRLVKQRGHEQQLDPRQADSPQASQQPAERPPGDKS